MRRLHRWACWFPLFASVAAIVSCNNSTDRAEPTKAKDRGQVKWIDPKTIQPGPIQHEKLSEQQMDRIRALQLTFEEVDRQSLEKWVDNFRRDADPDRELRIWERMAKAYTAFCEKRKLSLEAKKEAFRVVLMRSMATEPEVLEKTKLKELSREDAVKIMRGF